MECWNPGLIGPHSRSPTATYAPKLSADQLRLDFSKSAEELFRLVRLGGAWTTLEGRRIGVQSARWHAEQCVPGPPGSIQATLVATASGVLGLAEVRPAGRPSMSAADWARGALRGSPGRLGT